MTSARKHFSTRPRHSARAPASDDSDQLESRTRLKRARVEPEARNAVDASIDAALRELDDLEAERPPKKGRKRRVPPFPGTGITFAVPPLPSLRPKKS